VILLDRPDYRLEFLAPTPVETDEPTGQLARQPSYLLDPHREVVPFWQRPSAQQQLQAWLEDPEPVSAVLVTGPGGQGKTRLAGHIASSCYRAEWVIAQAVERHLRLRSGAGDQTLLADDQPLLVVVDYAERWRLNVLSQLVQSLPLDYPHRRVRVLLLARPVRGLWDALSAELDRTGIDLPDPIPLDGIDVADRAAAFTEAARIFAQRLQVPPPQPPSLEVFAEPAYGSPLTLHMAALAAAWGAREHQSVPVAPEELSRYLLRHEQRYWAAVVDQESTLLVGAEVIAQLVLLGTLLGPVSGHSAALTLLRRARLADGDAHAGQLLSVYERLYPPLPIDPPRAEQRSVTVATLAPLRPDRLGEDFIGQHLSTNPHARELLITLLVGRHPTTGADMMTIRRCQIVLAAAGARHDSAAETLFTLLQTHPRVVAEASAEVVQLVIDRATDAVATVVEAALPRYSSELLRQAAALAQRLYDVLPANATPAQRAQRLTKVGIRLSQAGDKRGALGPAEEAVRIYRRLAENEPAAYLADLAMSLANLGALFAEAGDKRGALGPAEEAVRDLPPVGRDRTGCLPGRLRYIPEQPGCASGRGG
jgi:tetratricopeptide (TPR) repeat protein